MRKRRAARGKEGKRGEAERDSEGKGRVGFGHREPSRLFRRMCRRRLRSTKGLLRSGGNCAESPEVYSRRVSSASPWAWDRRQPLGWGILVTASRSALWVLASRWAASHSEEAQPLGNTGNRSLRAPLRRAVSLLFRAPGSLLLVAKRVLDRKCHMELLQLPCRLVEGPVFFFIFTE